MTKYFFILFFWFKFSIAQNDSKLKDSLAFELCQIYGFDQGIRDFYDSQFEKFYIQTKETVDSRIEIVLNPLKNKNFIGCENEELNMPKQRN